MHNILWAKRNYSLILANIFKPANLTNLNIKGVGGTKKRNLFYMPKFSFPYLEMAPSFLPVNAFPVLNAELNTSNREGFG